MIRRLVALSALGSAAALGYVGARRLGRWLDGPLLEVPEQTRSRLDVSTEVGDPEEAQRVRHRWSERDMTRA